MTRALLLASILLLPTSVFGATLAADSSLRVSEPLPGNAYLAGAEVEVQAPLAGDLLAAGSLVRVLAPILGDVLGAGGTLTLSAPIAGDVRVLGGQILVDEIIGGEFAGLGGLIRLTKPVGEVRVLGASVEVLGGAEGPVTIYANNITLGGEFKDSVRVLASDAITLRPDTTIAGVLEYNAPQEARIPSSALVSGGVRYVGSASFVPTQEEAQAFAVAGFGIYFAVRIIAGMLLAGLVAGLFPAFTRSLYRETIQSGKRRSLLLFVIGFSVLVGVPLALILLMISVVGIGIGLLVGVSYMLLVLLGYVCAGIVLSGLASRVFFKARVIGWQEGALGAFLLYLIGLIPAIGFLVTLVLLSVSLGAMVVLFARTAFPKEYE